MTEELHPTSRAGRFRQAIAAFIETRRAAKLKGQEDAAGAASKYDYATWLADAARRVGQIQAVTHVLKATHPDARGSSLHVAPGGLPAHAEIGSHVLGKDYAEDVVGNAAALDVFKFLKVEVEGRRLLDWMQASDADLLAALSGDAAQAAGWMQAFASLVREDQRPASHPMAKQVYWLVGDDPLDDGGYHLLQPMFSSTLAHAVHTEIQDARFGEANTAARQAFRAGAPAEAVYRDYRGLVVRKLGGTKPQNISQLNSERGGVNYLLPSLPPPAWAPRGSNLFKRESAFDELLRFGGVRELVYALADFLKANPDPVADTREQRDTLAQAIADELGMFGATIRGGYAPGWSREAECQLPDCEQLWLDPGRYDLDIRHDPQHPEWTTQDEAFRRDYDWGDWPDELATRFGLWLNGQLRKRGDDALVGLNEPEMRHWAKQAVLDVAWPVPMQRRANRGAA
ncbi:MULTISPECIES: type I-F CRISPR-associated protein Csy1 [Pseudoxanthomonas]|uniref:CRISPR-associated protein Csy1 n=1 Tax=Pseudoxanthomonas winnipegensis TaxID=2480810 RepID=A0AAW8GH47_9GAMM|nr:MULTISPECIES: type I-F CRISPR-associated protein Csy1 [Pseudoxanthomonas]MDQ1120585.1 CRISPR-associated protein Csy1 [Pseudoxanthomonas winnipegensis]MDQ1133808.1 CRISPR-associated protein Csy1 [Pseudoxanthomonas winnipegensis]MDR6139954.1 CRISPR-associated protein Csy1 [Pseudoxanthomonas sp. SORGH_AS_0997]